MNYVFFPEPFDMAQPWDLHFIVKDVLLLLTNVPSFPGFTTKHPLSPLLAFILKISMTWTDLMSAAFHAREKCDESAALNGASGNGVSSADLTTFQQIPHLK